MLRVERGVEGDREGEETVHNPRPKVATTDVGRRVLPLAEDDVQSGSSDWELRERRARKEERREVAEELGAEDLDDGIGSAQLAAALLTRLPREVTTTLMRPRLTAPLWSTWFCPKLCYFRSTSASKPLS
jgi:hypothetical protein